MSSDHSHRGVRAPGPFAQPVDRRVLELDEALRGTEVTSGAVPALGFHRDPTRAAQAVQSALGMPGNMSRGMVVHPLGAVNWYRVQCGDGGGTIAACMLMAGSATPLGPKELAMAGAGDSVLVFRPHGLSFGIIVGVLPPVVSEGSINCPDWITQAGGSGVRREPAHRFPISGMYRQGGVRDFSAQRPPDQTSLDRGWVSPFGPALTVDDAMVQARVSEMCGLWLTSADGWARLAGEQLLIESPVHEESSGNDEGESRYFVGVATYAWEALGLRTPGGTGLTAETPDKDVQYTAHTAKIDLADGSENARPIYRYQEYGGYLGQGHVRTVICPGQESGLSRFGGGPADVGLFRESIGLDGDYSLVSAKGIHIGKRLLIPAPRPIALPQDAAGDDATADNYRFAGTFGTAAEHKVTSAVVEGGFPKSMLRAAAVLDLVSHHLNWKVLHPFHYHAADYSTPQESQAPGFSRNQESVDFGSGFFADDPAPQRLNIDHRYGQVEYFARESFIRFHDDGTVHLAGGAGEEIILGGGRVVVSAPLGVDLRPGGDLSILAAQVIVRSKESVDISSSYGDVRLKAQGNMQLLAGNGGSGGMLIESKGRGTGQRYAGNFGEDVGASGVVIKASEGMAAVLGKDVYLRTGGEGLGEGDITLDASRGNRRCQVFGREFNVYAGRAVTFSYGPLGSDSTVRKVYYFGDNTMIADVTQLLGGKLIGYTGESGKTPGIIVDGGVYGTKSFATAGVMADKKGGFLGKVPEGFIGQVRQATAEAAKAAGEVKTFTKTIHEVTIVQKYYQAGQIGDDETISAIAFSFRDPPGSASQYRTDRFAWPESRWQSLVRFGLGTGGVKWTETPVVYQGRQTYPWPGKAKWVDEPSFLRLEELTMFNAADGVAADRPGPYESPTLSDWEESPPDGEYTLTR